MSNNKSASPAKLPTEHHGWIVTGIDPKTRVPRKRQKISAPFFSQGAANRFKELAEKQGWLGVKVEEVLK